MAEGSINTVLNGNMGYVLAPAVLLNGTLAFTALLRVRLDPISGLAVVLALPCLLSNKSMVAKIAHAMGGFCAADARRDVVLPHGMRCPLRSDENRCE